MEVHPPHAPLHGWRDFWIHLGTIAVGLLIAIALEQSVESLHRLHQRHQLEEDFWEEASKNRDLIDGDVVYLKNSTEQLDAERKIAAEAKVVDGAVTFALPAMDDRADYVAPSRAVWSTASAGALIDLLPSPEARMFSRADYEAQQYEESFAKFADLSVRLNTLAREFSTGREDGSSVWTMPAAQRDGLVTLAAEYAVLDEQVMQRLRYLQWAEEEVLGGAKDLDEMMQGMNRRADAAK
jgi:hypothetical protein